MRQVEPVLRCLADKIFKGFAPMCLHDLRTAAGNMSNHVQFAGVPKAYTMACQQDVATEPSRQDHRPFDKLGCAPEEHPIDGFA